MGANKKVSCKICSQVIRSEILKRHMKNHVDLSLRVPEQLCKDIKSSKDETSMYSENPKVNDQHSDGLDELHKPLIEDVDKMQLKDIILYDMHMNGNLN